MNYTLALLAGMFVAIMITVNGELSEQYGLYWATVFIHLAGLCLITIIVLAKKERPFAVRYPWFFYLAGAIGVFNVVSNNFAFGRISVSAILALGLLGQGVSGLIINHYGLWGMARRPFSRGNLVGLVLIFCGIAPMLTDFEILAVILSFAVGIGVILNVTFNARLANVTSVRISTFFNYVTGLSVALLVYFMFDIGETPLFGVTFSHTWYVYTGGFIGVAVITLSNVIVPKIGAFYLTLLMFIGQIFAGILIDAMLDGAFSLRIFLGGALVSAGLGANLLLDRKRAG